MSPEISSDLPDQFTSINTDAFTFPTNNTSDLTTPPDSNVINTYIHPPTNVALMGNIDMDTNQNSNATPPPNTVVSISCDLIPTLPSVYPVPIPASLSSRLPSSIGGSYLSSIHPTGGVITTPPELHNEGGECIVYSCTNCLADMEVKWHCKECGVSIIRCNKTRLYRSINSYFV